MAECRNKLKCILCSNNESPYWRSVPNYGIICNLCYNNKFSNKTNFLTNYEKDIEDVKSIRKSARVSKLQKNIPLNRRNYFKKKPFRAVNHLDDKLFTNSIFHKGVYYQIGDVIALISSEFKTYFAQIMNIIKDYTLNHRATIIWLIPYNNYEGQFNPKNFKLGFEDPTPRCFDSFEFVCRLPLNFYYHNDPNNNCNYGHSILLSSKI